MPDLKEFVLGLRSFLVLDSFLTRFFSLTTTKLVCFFLHSSIIPFGSPAPIPMPVCMWEAVFPLTTLSNFQPAGALIIQPNADAICLERAPDSPGDGVHPAGLPSTYRTRYTGLKPQAVTCAPDQLAGTMLQGL